MLRLFATPKISAFLPSRRPITHLRERCPSSRQRSSTSTMHGARIVKRNQQVRAAKVEQHVVRVARALLAIVLQVAESHLLIRSDRRDVRARRTDHAIG